MEEIDLKAICSLISRKKYYIISIIVIILLIGIIYSYKYVVPNYKASTTLIIGKNLEPYQSGMVGIITDNRINETDNKVVKTEQIEPLINSDMVLTYNELIKSKSVLSQIIKNLNLNMDEKTLRKSIIVGRLSESEMIEISVKNKSAKVACDIANEISSVFSERIKEIYNIHNVYVIDKAIPEDAILIVNHVRDIFLFLILGILVSGCFLIFYSIFDTTIKSVDDIEKISELKNLNIIPIKKEDYRRRKEQSELIINENENSILLEAFRTLRTNIQFTNLNNNKEIILVTSCFSTEGKSYISSNLAIAFAEAGKKVILIDADISNSNQKNLFGINNSIGLSNYLSSINNVGIQTNFDIGKYINETSVKNLNVITAGNIPPNSTELLTSNKLPELCKQLQEYYDLIIFDGAPVLPVADSLILTRIATATILVTLYNKTKKEELLRAKKDIQNIGGRIIGTVLNKYPIDDYQFNNRYYYHNINDKSNRKLNFLNSNKIKKNVRKEKKILVRQRAKIRNTFTAFKRRMSEREPFIIRFKKFFGFILENPFKLKYKLLPDKAEKKDNNKKENKNRIDKITVEKEDKKKNKKDKNKKSEIKEEKELIEKKDIVDNKVITETQNNDASFISFIRNKLSKDIEKEKNSLIENLETVEVPKDETLDYKQENILDFMNNKDVNDSKSNKENKENKEPKTSKENKDNTNTKNDLKEDKKMEDKKEEKIDNSKEHLEDSINKEIEEINKNIDVLENNLKDEKKKAEEREEKKKQRQKAREERKILVQEQRLRNKAFKEDAKRKRKLELEKLKKAAQENTEKVKNDLNNKKEKVKEDLSNKKKETIDLKNKIVDEFKVKKQENEEIKQQKKAEKEGYNERKREDYLQRKLEREARLKQQKEDRIKAQEEMKVKREEEKKMREVERALMKKHKEEVRRQKEKKRMAKRGLRVAEKENKRNQREKIRQQEREEARISEEIEEDNLYPKMKDNKDI